MCVLKTINLKKYYGATPNLVKALDGVNLDIEEGDFVSIVGTSGSGKSTLLHILGGLDKPTYGKVYVRGKDILNMNSEELTIFRRRYIGFVFQNYNLIPMLNVLDNITLPIELDGGKVDKDFLNKIVNILGLEEKLNDLPNNLSGGQQQRVAIALLKTTSKIFNQTIVMITHNDDIAQLADKTIRIEDGKVVGGINNDLS
ncbi:Lipoprotein-releasing system ATP-binding protein LolD [compost metagenome]